jgi:AmiR/NasT family two-component response regulator
MSLNIAVADDEVDMRDFYERILGLLGHRVVVAAGSGRELVDYCLRCRPDLIITDITMPEMNGDEAVEAICRDEPLPVIVVTAHHDSGRLTGAKSRHITAYLIKPIGRRDLEATIGPTMRRFDCFRRLRLEARDGLQADADQRDFERAARLLMRTSGLDQHAAYERLYSMAVEGERRLAEASRWVLDTANR